MSQCVESHLHTVTSRKPYKEALLGSINLTGLLAIKHSFPFLARYA